MYLVNWATVEDFECHRDDNGVDDIIDLAQPAGILVASLDKIADILERAYNEMREAYVDPNDMPAVRWVNVNTHHWILVEDDGKLFAVLIIAEREVM